MVMIIVDPPVAVEVYVAVLPFTVVVLTETEVVVTVVRLAAGVTVLIGVVVCFSVAVRETVVEKVVVGTVATELVAILVVHASSVEVEAMTGEVKVGGISRAKTESLGMDGIMVRIIRDVPKDARKGKEARCVEAKEEVEEYFYKKRPG